MPAHPAKLLSGHFEPFPKVHSAAFSPYLFAKGVIMKQSLRATIPVAGQWAGRIAALLLLLFWGGFFVEHLLEWFLRPDGAYPPPWVWVQQFLHLVILVGFGLMLKWDRLGALLAAGGSLAFFGGLMLRDGELETTFLLLILLNLIPAGFFVPHWLHAARSE
jgi:hypothetical protein